MTKPVARMHRPCGESVNPVNGSSWVGASGRSDGKKAVSSHRTPQGWLLDGRVKPWRKKESGVEPPHFTGVAVGWARQAVAKERKRCRATALHRSGCWMGASSRGERKKAVSSHRTPKSWQRGTNSACRSEPGGTALVVIYRPVRQRLHARWPRAGCPRWIWLPSHRQATVQSVVEGRARPLVTVEFGQKCEGPYNGTSAQGLHWFAFFRSGPIRRSGAVLLRLIRGRRCSRCASCCRNSR